MIRIICLGLTCEMGQGQPDAVCKGFLRGTKAVTKNYSSYQPYNESQGSKYTAFLPVSNALQGSQEPQDTGEH